MQPTDTHESKVVIEQLTKMDHAYYDVMEQEEGGFHQLWSQVDGRLPSLRILPLLPPVHVQPDVHHVSDNAEGHKAL